MNPLFPWTQQRPDYSFYDDEKQVALRHDQQDEEDAERSSRPPDSHWE